MDFFALILLLIGLVAGCLIGWFAHATRTPPPPAAPQPAAALPTGVGKDDLALALAPLTQSLSTLDGQVTRTKTDQDRYLASIGAQVQALVRAQTRLNDRTEQLTRALHSPATRGRWGEVSLERIIELAGMTTYVDYSTQVTGHHADTGSTRRPDLVIRLSGERVIIIDAKVPLSSYLDALETTDPEEHEGYLRRHAHQVRSHLMALGKKQYHHLTTDTGARSLEFVVAFLPADPFLDAALKVDPDLLDDAFAANVIPATPATLMGLLKAVAVSWQQHAMTERAEEIVELGSQLHRRISTVHSHLSRLGTALDRAVTTYNDTVTSVDARLAVTTRKLEELHLGRGGTTALPNPVTQRVSTPHSPPEQAGT